jgi:hypothetical protein
LEKIPLKKIKMKMVQENIIIRNKKEICKVIKMKKIQPCKSFNFKTLENHKVHKKLQTLPVKIKEIQIEMVHLIKMSLHLKIKIKILVNKNKKMILNKKIKVNKKITSLMEITFYYLHLLLIIITIFLPGKKLPNHPQIPMVQNQILIQN